jgi:peptide/nickel transport system substrate-binding protein
MLNSKATYVKNDNYWQAGKPYLDKVEFLIVPDAVAATTMMASGQADIMYGTSGGAIKGAVDLKNKGLNLRFAAAGFLCLSPDSINAASPWANKTFRMALETAINRPALAKAVGYGLLDSTNQFCAPNSPTYDPNYAGRTYDIAKAKQLLAEAGFTTGVSTTLICDLTSFQRDISTAIQSDWAAINVTGSINPQDNASIQNMAFGKTTWTNGTILTGAKGDPGAAFMAGLLRDFGVPGSYVSVKRSDEYVSILNQLNNASSLQEMDKLSKQLIKQASDEVMTVPLCTQPFFVVYGPKVHTSFGIVPAPPIWDFSGEWKEK